MNKIKIYNVLSMYISNYLLRSLKTNSTKYFYKSTFIISILGFTSIMKVYNLINIASLETSITHKIINLIKSIISECRILRIHGSHRCDIDKIKIYLNKYLS